MGCNRVVAVESVPHFQVCALLVLSIVLVPVPEVMDESDAAAAPPQPVQLETVSAPATLTGPWK